MGFDHYRRYTQARIGLGHAGPALPTKEWLQFSLHHASAIDAIAKPLDLKLQTQQLLALGFSSHILKTLAEDRPQFLLRPDLGRKLDAPSREYLQVLGPEQKSNVLIMASNGLSSLAVINHLSGFLKIFLAKLSDEGLHITHDQILLIANGRVGLIDEIGEIIRPTLGITFIGERPGLSAPDSLAAYLTYEPKTGRTDAERNCISNIRPPHGLSYEEASSKLMFLIKEALRRKLSGISLKDETVLGYGKSIYSG